MRTTRKMRIPMPKKSKLDLAGTVLIQLYVPERMETALTVREDQRQTHALSLAVQEFLEGRLPKGWSMVVEER